MSLFSKKMKHVIVMLLVFAMMLQIVGPTVYAYADSVESQDFRITDIKFVDQEDGTTTAVVDWEFDYDSSRVEERYTLEVPFWVDEEVSGDVFSKVSGEEIKVGTFIADENGEISIYIAHDLENEVRYLTQTAPSGEHEPGNPSGEPEPGNPSGEPEPGNPSGEHEPGNPSGEPEPGNPSGEPEPGNPSGEPKPGNPSGEPEPGNPSGEPEPGNPSGEPEPGNPSGEPEPGNPSGEPEPGNTSGQPEPADPINEGGITQSMRKAILFIASTGGDFVGYEGSVKYTFYGNFEVKGARSSIMPFSDSTVEGTVPESVIHTVIAKNNANGEPIQDIPNYRPKMGDELWVEIRFALEANHSYGAGSTLTYELPEPLKAGSGKGTLAENGTVYAGFEVINGEVVITFNENIRQHDNGIAIQDAYFGITANFESSQTDLNQEVELPNKDADTGTIKIPIYFQPVGGTTVSKVVNPPNGRNISELTWTVNVNTTMNDLGTEGKLFKDSLEGTNHKYKAGSLKVTRYIVDTKGEKSPGQDVTSDFGQLTGNEEVFELTLTGEYAYEIEYVTIPGETSNASQTLKNEAEFDGKSDPKNVTITYGKPLEKTGKAVAPRGTTEWTIVVNDNEKTIASGTKITDTWSDGHVLKTETFNVVGLDINEYEVTHNETGFELTLKNNVSKKFTITYKTNLKDINGVISVDTPITNQVIRSDRGTEDKESNRKKTINYNQNVLSKPNRNSSHINYQDKTVDWEITINNDGYEMKDIVLTDIFTNKNLKIVDGTFKVNRGTTELTTPSGYTLNHTDGNEVGDKKGGFILNIPNAEGSKEKYTITYTTEYDIKNSANPEADSVYTNEAQVKWKTNSEEYSSPKITSTVTINNQQKKNGYKEGYYNYEQKKFYWEVGFNYNFDTITTPIFTDTLKGAASQIIDPESIKVYKLDLSGGGNGIIDGEPLNEGEDYVLTYSADSASTFTIAFRQPINGPYRIVYKSETKHDYYEPKTGNYIISNEAIFKDSTTKRGEWKDDVEVKYSNKLITKTPIQDGGSTGSGTALVHWTLNLNWSQSTIKSPVIEDTIGKDSAGNLNQMLFKDTFKITEMNFSGTDSTPSSGTVHYPGGELYDIAFSEGTTDPTFTITFKKDIDKAYIVEYDTYFLGANNTNIENTATLSYKYNSDDSTGESSNSSTEEYKVNFKYYGGASANKGQFQITKVNEDNTSETLSGAVFQLWSRASDGVMIEEISTDEDGVYTFQTKLGYATYYLVEIKAPDFYDLDSSEYKDRKPVELNQGLQQLTITNKKFNQAVEITKVAEHDDSILLEGVKFKLQLKDTSGIYNDVSGYVDLETDEDGKIYIDELIPSEYRLIETETLPGYRLDITPIEFEISNGQLSAIKKEVKNSKQGDIIIKKIDESANPLAGAVFTITDVDDLGHKYVSNITGTDGVAKFENVKYGTYNIEETTIPDGYVGLSKIIEIVVDDSTNFVETPNTIAATITNEKIYQAVKLTKTETGKPSILLKGAEFTLYKEDGTEVSKHTTDSNGEIAVNNLEPGNYYFEETKAPDYYLLPTNARTTVFEIKANQTEFSTVAMENTRGEGKIVIEKIDSSSKLALDGVDFKLSNADGSVERTGTTNAEGILVFENLPYDIYTIEETKEKSGYVPNTSSITIVLDGKDSEGKVVNSVEKKEVVENTRKDYSVRLIKYNSSKTQKLAGAVFELRKLMDGKYEVIGTFTAEQLTTDKNGEIYLEDLEPGEYQFVEIRAPRGYDRNRTPVEFEILENQVETIEVEKTNRRTWDPGPGTDRENPEDPEDSDKPDEKEEPKKPEGPGPETPGPGPENPGPGPETPGPEPETPGPETPGPGPETPGPGPETPGPERPPVEETTEPEKPVEVTPPDIPEGSTPEVKEPPKNGTVTFDENGKWIYTPNPGFTGEDTFIITITHPNGTTEDILITVNVTPPKGNVLPKTGELNPILFYIAGVMMIGLGVVLRRRTIKG